MACSASWSDRSETIYKECVKYAEGDNEEELSKFVAKFTLNIVKEAVVQSEHPIKAKNDKSSEEISGLEHQELVQGTENISNEKERDVRRTRSEENVKFSGNEIGLEKVDTDGAKTASSATDEATKTRANSLNDQRKAEGGGIGDKIDSIGSSETLKRVRFPIEKFDLKGRLMNQSILATSSSVNRVIQEAVNKVSDEQDESKRVDEFIRTIIKARLREKRAARNKTDKPNNGMKSDKSNKSLEEENKGPVCANGISSTDQFEGNGSDTRMITVCSKATQVESIHDVFGVENVPMEISSQTETNLEICKPNESFSSAKSISSQKIPKHSKTTQVECIYTGSSESAEEEPSYKLVEKKIIKQKTNRKTRSNNKIYETKDAENSHTMKTAEVSPSSNKSERTSSNCSSKELMEEFQFQYLNATEDENGYVFVQVHEYDPYMKEDPEVKSKTSSLHRLLKKLFPSHMNVTYNTFEEIPSDSSTSQIDSDVENESIKRPKKIQSKGKKPAKPKKESRNTACCFSRKQKIMD